MNTKAIREALEDLRLSLEDHPNTRTEHWERYVLARDVVDAIEAAPKVEAQCGGVGPKKEAVAPEAPSGSIKDTLAAFDELLTAQGGKCAICETKDPGTRGWTFDRSHYTKAKRSPRAVLCPDCNVMLDYAKDSTRVLEAAVRHLLRSPI